MGAKKLYENQPVISKKLDKERVVKRIEELLDAPNGMNYYRVKKLLKGLKSRHDSRVVSEVVQELNLTYEIGIFEKDIK